MRQHTFVLNYTPFFTVVADCWGPSIFWWTATPGAAFREETGMGVGPVVAYYTAVAPAAFAAGVSYSKPIRLSLVLTCWILRWPTKTLVRQISSHLLFWEVFFATGELTGAALAVIFFDKRYFLIYESVLVTLPLWLGLVCVGGLYRIDPIPRLSILSVHLDCLKEDHLWFRNVAFLLGLTFFIPVKRDLLKSCRRGRIKTFSIIN